MRLDSGDLLSLAKAARAMLNEAGLERVEILASGGLDETKIAALVESGAPIDAFGGGADMSVSADTPALDIAYKLTTYTGEGRLKLSSGKPYPAGRQAGVPLRWRRCHRPCGRGASWRAAAETSDATG